MACWKQGRRAETEKSRDCKPYWDRKRKGWKDQREGEKDCKREGYRAQKGLESLMKPNCVLQNTFTITVGGEGTRMQRSKGEGVQREAHKPSISLIFTFMMTFTSCCSRPGSRWINEGRSSETPGSHIRFWLNLIGYLPTIWGGGIWPPLLHIQVV